MYCYDFNPKNEQSNSNLYTETRLAINNYYTNTR